VKDKLTTPWLVLVEDTWITETGREVFCDGFWRYFDWVPPREGKQLRLVLSTIPVDGAQETRLTRDSDQWHWARLRNDPQLVPLGDPIFTTVVDHGLDSFFEVSEADVCLDSDADPLTFVVYWWPEYR
jgi:hypothetical protein